MSFFYLNTKDVSVLEGSDYSEEETEYCDVSEEDSDYWYNDDSDDDTVLTTMTDPDFVDLLELLAIEEMMKLNLLVLRKRCRCSR